MFTFNNYYVFMWLTFVVANKNLVSCLRLKLSILNIRYNHTLLNLSCRKLDHPRILKRSWCSTSVLWKRHKQHLMEYYRISAVYGNIDIKTHTPTASSSFWEDPCYYYNTIINIITAYLMLSYTSLWAICNSTQKEGTRLQLL